MSRNPVSTLLATIDEKTPVRNLRDLYNHGENSVTIIGTIVFDPKIVVYEDFATITMVVGGHSANGLWLCPVKIRGNNLKKAQELVKAANLKSGENVSIIGSYASHVRQNEGTGGVDIGSVNARFIKNLRHTEYDLQMQEVKGVRGIDKVLKQSASVNNALFVGYSQDGISVNKRNETAPFYGSIIVPEMRHFNPKYNNVDSVRPKIELSTSVTVDNVIPFSADIQAFTSPPEQIAAMDIISCVGMLRGKVSSEKELSLGYPTHRVFLYPTQISKVRSRRERVNTSDFIKIEETEGEVA